MPKRLAGKVAVITGGGGGIGGAIAEDMAAEGASVVVNDIGKDENGNSEADNVVKKIKEAGGTAVANYDSITTMAGGRKIIQTAISNFGRIDILVNTAGFSRPGKAVEMSEETWDEVIAVHLKGHFACSQPAAREMIKQKSGGRIITFCAGAGFVFPDVPLFGIGYATAKAGIVGFTAKLSGELKEHNITVNSIIPSAVTKGFPEKLPGVQPPEFVPPIVVYLCTDEAKDITGQFFYAGGGDVGIYDRPMQRPATLYSKIGKWTVDELSRVIPNRLKSPPAHMPSD